MDRVYFQAGSSERQNCTSFTQTGNSLAAAALSRYMTWMQVPQIAFPPSDREKLTLPGNLAIRHPETLCRIIRS